MARKELKNKYGVYDFKDEMVYSGTLEEVAEWLDIKPQTVLVRLIRQKKNPFVPRRYTIKVIAVGAHGSSHYEGK